MSRNKRSVPDNQLRNLVGTLRELSAQYDAASKLKEVKNTANFCSGRSDAYEVAAKRIEDLLKKNGVYTE